MDTWLETLLTSFAHTSSDQQLFERIANAAAELGFEYCSFGIKMPLPITNPRIFIFDNYKPEWRSQYQKENYLSIDPTVAHGIRSVLPLIWSESIFQKNPIFWADAEAHGLRTGWTQSCYNSYGVGGMLTLARSNEALNQSEIKTNASRMSTLVQVAHEFFVTRLLTQNIPEYSIKLHPREREVLLWTVEGKTAAEVGIILNVTERTVNHYIGQAMQKLNATNKMAAAIKALSVGLL